MFFWEEKFKPIYCLNFFIRGGGVASGDFNLAKRPLIPSYGFKRQGVCVCVWTFSLTTIKRYTCAHYTPVLRENFLLTPLVFFWGCWLSCSMWTDAALFVFILVLVTIFGSNAQPMTSYAAQILMLFNLGIGMPRGTFWFVACYRNLCWPRSQIPLFSLRAVLQLN